MDITQSQREQVHRWLGYAALGKRLQSSDNTRTPDPAKGCITSWSPNEISFALVAALNLPAFVKVQLIRFNATKQAVGSWARWSSGTRSGRWTSGTLDWLGVKDKIITLNSTVKYVQATREWGDRFWLTPKNHFYTWITNSFVHLDLGHLMSNMISLFSVAPICSRLPNMTPAHISAITVGSAICASAALVAEWKLRSSPGFQKDTARAAGASGIVSAFIAVAAAGAPKDKLTLNGISVPCWFLAVLSFGGDIVGMLRLDELVIRKQRSWLEAVGKLKVGYAAHLGGAAFGLIYYYCVLHPRAVKTKESPKRSQ